MAKFLLTILILFLSPGLISETNSFRRSSKQSDISFDKLVSNVYYSGRINENRVFVYFDSINVNYVTGHYFVLTNNAFANKIDFKLIPKRNSFNFVSENFEKEIRVDIDCKRGTFYGHYKINKKFLGVFNRYSDKTEINFRIHEQAEFIKFPERYYEPVFDEVAVKHDVIYGSARGYYDSYCAKGETYWRILERGIMNTIIKRNLVLKMDIYMPESDTQEKRPLIMFIHGGGFYIGDKQSTALITWSEYFASLGYVVASINYRIGFKPLKHSVERAGYRAVQDAHAAMRFLIHNRDFYRIDTSKLNLAGTSAGAITALHLAFMRNQNRPASSFGSFVLEDLGNIESCTNNYSYDFDIKNVANMWGAVYDLDILQNSNTAVISFHCVDDQVVPYGYDFPFKDIRGRISQVVFDKIYGSFTIHQRLRELNRREKLHTFMEQGHSPHVHEPDYSSLSENFYFIKNEIKEFFFYEILPERNYITGMLPTLFPGAQIMYRTGNQDFNDIRWGIEGGIIIGTSENMVRVVWFKDANQHCLFLSTLHDSGAASYDEYRF